MIRRFAIFGASGDLTTRYLLPALAQLAEAGKLPLDFEVVGIARANWDTDILRDHARQALERHVPGIPAVARERFAARLTYHRADVVDRAQVAAAFARGGEPLVAYLALPPRFFAPAVEALRALHPPAGSRIVIEKPFGEDLGSARTLNRLLHETFPEHAVFRIDHFLGKQTVQNILGLRFANRIWEPIWTGQHVERVEIVWDETLTVDGRAGYYDTTGALRDMVQNHLLQLLALIAMEVPRTLGERDFRDRKVDVFRAVRRMAREEVARHTVRGRYERGEIDGRPVAAYVEVEGVDPTRETETFAQVTLWLDNWRWADVPFVLRTGKALGEARQEISIRFKPVPQLTFGQTSQPLPNVLRLSLDPDRVALGININGPGDPFDLEPVELDVTLLPQELTAYARLMLDVIAGEPTLSIRDDEAEESWRIIEPILAGWREQRAPLLEYPAGSTGPAPRAATRSGPTR